jgi:hypothetical protein
LRGWNGRRLHRPIVDIQFPSNQHHGGKHYRQHCGEKLVDFSLCFAGYFANPKERWSVNLVPQKNGPA